MSWNNASQLTSREYICGFCGNIVATATGFFDKNGQNFVYICPHCDKPTFFDYDDSQTPGIAPGNEVHNLPDELAALYREARNSVLKWTPMSRQKHTEFKLHISHTQLHGAAPMLQ
jgi:DNA-directed RNA polymerase subunit RPC12/RpoP